MKLQLTLMKQEFTVFITALKTYTHLPIPVPVNMTSESVKRSIRYFPAAGLLVAVVSYCVYWLAARVLPAPVPAALCVAAMVLATGAFHEDGFADFCDGFGGGHSCEKVLLIMKDSTIGTFGAVGLVLLLGLKFLLLSSVPVSMMFVSLLIASVVSRGAAASVIFFMPYARASDPSAKWKILSTEFSAANLAVISLTSLLCLLFVRYQLFILVPALTIVVATFFSLYIKRRIGGYTGDCLGALQCLVEVAIYALFSADNFLRGTHIF